LKLIVLPTVKDGAIKPEHLEDIALAVYETDTKMLEIVNEKIEKETSYTKKESDESEIVTLVKRFQENKYGNILFSLLLGYGLVLATSLIYVVLTQQDFIVFSKENPEIIILGGACGFGCNRIEK